MPYEVRSAQMKGAGVNVTEGDIAVGMPLVAQAAHGFSLGTVLRQLNANDYTTARANTLAAIGVGLGLVIDVPNADSFTMLVRPGADVSWPGHPHGSTFGTELWLSQSIQGAMTTTRPDVGFIRYLGYVIDSNTIRWEPWARTEEE